MTFAKKTLSSAAIALLMAGGALAVTGGSASARVACNRDGDCWHTDQKVQYPHELGVQVHPDHWYFHQRWNEENNNRHYRDYHDGRGYYKGGVWVTF